MACGAAAGAVATVCFGFCVYGSVFGVRVRVFGPDFVFRVRCSGFEVDVRGSGLGVWVRVSGSGFGFRFRVLGLGCRVRVSDSGIRRKPLEFLRTLPLHV